MRTGSSPLLPLLRSEVQGELLALLLLQPDDSSTITELAASIRRPMQTVQREVARLAEAGLLTERRVGNMKYVQADTSTPLYRPLADLMAVTYGPEPVLRQLFADFAEVSEAYIYGSWAARRSGESGPVPVDLDVLIVGSLPVDVLDSVADAAEGQLHREVHIRQVSPDDWHEAASPFLGELKARPLISLREVA